MRLCHMSKSLLYSIVALITATIVSVVFLSAAFAGNQIALTSVTYTNPTSNTLAFVLAFTGDDNADSIAAVSYKQWNSDSWISAGAAGKNSNTYTWSNTSLSPNMLYDVKFVITDPDGGGTTFYTKGYTSSIPSTQDMTFTNGTLLNKPTLMSTTTSSSVIVNMPYYADEDADSSLSLEWVRVSDGARGIVSATKVTNNAVKTFSAAIPVTASNVGTCTIKATLTDPDGYQPSVASDIETITVEFVSNNILRTETPVLSATSNQIFMTIPFADDANANAMASYRYKTEEGAFSDWQVMYRDPDHFSSTQGGLLPNTRYLVEFSYEDPEGTIPSSATGEATTKMEVGSSNVTHIPINSVETTVPISDNYYWWVGKPLEIRIAPDAVGRPDVAAVTYTWSITFDRFASKLGPNLVEVPFTTENITEYMDVESPVITTLTNGGPFLTSDILRVTFNKYGAYRYVITYDANITYNDGTTEHLIFEKENVVYTLKGNLAIQ